MQKLSFPYLIRSFFLLFICICLPALISFSLHDFESQQTVLDGYSKSEATLFSSDYTQEHRNSSTWTTNKKTDPDTQPLSPKTFFSEVDELDKQSDISLLKTETINCLKLPLTSSYSSVSFVQSTSRDFILSRLQTVMLLN